MSANGAQATGAELLRVADLSHTITVLARGSVLAEGPYAEVSRNPKVLEAYIGSAAEA